MFFALFAVRLEGEAVLNRDLAGITSARRSLAHHKMCHLIFRPNQEI